MKQKITIMKQRLDLSDEEIGSYMDFDALRKKHQEVLGIKRNRNSLLIWSAATVIVLTVAIIFFNGYKIESPKVVSQTKAKPSLSNQSNQAVVTSPVDTIQSEIKSVQVLTLKKSVEANKVEQKNSKVSAVPIEPRAGESIYVQAEPIDGYAALYEYLNTNLRYPMESLGDSIQGVQTVSFIINVDGRPEDIQFTESLGVPFEKEARRLIESMPRWKPATLNGKPVPSKLALPITFQIQSVQSNKE